MHWLNNVTLKDIAWLIIPTLSNQATKPFTRHCKVFGALNYDIFIICGSWVDWALKDGGAGSLISDPQFRAVMILPGGSERQPGTGCPRGEGVISTYLVSSPFCPSLHPPSGIFTPVWPSHPPLHLPHLCWANLIGCSEFKNRDACVTGQRVSLGYPVTLPQLYPMEEHLSAFPLEVGLLPGLQRKLWLPTDPCCPVPLPLVIEGCWHLN